MDIIDIGYAKKLFKGVASGFDHAASTTNADGTVTMTMYWKNGTNTPMTFPKPVGVNDIKIDIVNVSGVDEYHLFFTLDDGKIIDSGNILNIESLSEQDIKDIWQEVLNNN